MKFVIAGGSGALGQRLAAHFERQGHEVIVLTRRASTLPFGKAVQWDGRTLGEWQAHLHNSIIINLAGKLVDVRPTKANIEELRRSRVDATLVLKQALINNHWVAPLWLQMSSLAIYGDCGDVVLDESAKPIKPLPQMTGVATPWEAAFADAPVERGAILRTGIVLDNNTPAMRKLVSITRLGMGGRIASGEQWISWIHIDDFIRAVQHIIDIPSVRDVVHVTSPNPINNKTLMKELRRVNGRPSAPPTPAFAVKLGAFAMGSDPALALTGRRCIPRRLSETGFTFQYPELSSALLNLHLNQAQLTYAEIGATNGVMPAGRVHHEFSEVIGTGREAFESCAAWLEAWNLQRAVGFDVLSSTTKIQKNTIATLSIRLLGLRIQAPCKVVYVVNEESRRGFAYGTLKGHPESGEEYFGVTIDEQDQVRFVLRAFSKPATLLAKLGGPITRRLQLRVQRQYVEAARSFICS